MNECYTGCIFTDIDAFSVVTVETSGARASFVDCRFAQNHILAADKQVKLGLITGTVLRLDIGICTFLDGDATFCLHSKRLLLNDLSERGVDFV